jgi:protein tyrosine phosphatase (PTP) superfamily phosphohydrolase (DUF442 family)
MRRAFKISIRIFIWLVLTSYVSLAQIRKDTWAKKIPSNNLQNLYRVDDSLQRSEQPSEQALQEVEQSGIKSVLNLRKSKEDVPPSGTHLVFMHVGMKAGTLSYNDLVAALKAINKAPKPVLVHCKYGADRTGCVVAAYNILNRHYSKEEAIEEMRSGGYNFHEKYYAGMFALLNFLDVDQLRKDVQK